MKTGGPNTEKCHLLQKLLFVICILIFRTCDKHRLFHQCLSWLVVRLRHELFMNSTKMNWGLRWAGGPKIHKIFNTQFHTLTMFPCFIISGASLQVDYSIMAISEEQ